MKTKTNAETPKRKDKTRYSFHLLSIGSIKGRFNIKGKVIRVDFSKENNALSIETEKREKRK